MNLVCVDWWLLELLCAKQTLIMSNEQMVLRGTLEGTLILYHIIVGHSGWVTSLTTSPESPDILLSGSRGKWVTILLNIRQDDHPLALDPLRGQVRHSTQIDDWPQPLCVWRCRFVRRKVLSFGFMGQDPPSMEPRYWWDHPPLCWPRQRSPLRLILPWQPSNRVWFNGQINQALEHRWRVQDDTHRRVTHRMGLPSPLLSKLCKPSHRVFRMGQSHQGKQPLLLRKWCTMYLLLQRVVPMRQIIHN